MHARTYFFLIYVYIALTIELLIFHALCSHFHLFLSYLSFYHILSQLFNPIHSHKFKWGVTPRV